jgi:branched-chain amino acid transport system substrate-binding protein
MRGPARRRAGPAGRGTAPGARRAGRDHRRVHGRRPAGRDLQPLLHRQVIKPVYSALVDPNKTDLTDEIAKAKAAGADVIMPWSAATGLLARLLNARGDMGWKVPVVGHPALMAAQIRKLLNKPEYWNDAFAPATSAPRRRPDGKLPAATQALRRQDAPALGGGEIDVMFWWVALGYDCVKIIEHASRPPAAPTRPRSRRRWTARPSSRASTRPTRGRPPSATASPTAGWSMNARGHLQGRQFKLAR